jgi:hypothetical protein
MARLTILSYRTAKQTWAPSEQFPCRKQEAQITAVLSEPPAAAKFKCHTIIYHPAQTYEIQQTDTK